MLLWRQTMVPRLWTDFSSMHVHAYLPMKRHMTLSYIMSSITNQFIPAIHYKYYVFRNFKQSDIYRSYNPTVVPSYLHGRPKQTILHCLHRQASINKFSQSDITQMNPHSWKVWSEKQQGKARGGRTWRHVVATICTLWLHSKGKNRGCKLQGSLCGRSHDGRMVFSTKLKPSG